MRKVIEGKIYDTDRAELIAINRHWSDNDPRSYCIRLYHTPNGNWFYHVIGGVLSDYALHEGRFHYNTNCLKIATELEAKEFAVRYASLETFLRFWSMAEA